MAAAKTTEADHVCVEDNTPLGPGEKPFEDPDFPANDSSLYNVQEDPNIPPGCLRVKKWLRPSEICTEPHLFVEGVMAGDVVQGGLGNCWFLGALMLLGTRTDLLMRLFAFQSKKGMYKIRFFTEGAWQSITIDDRIPCDENGNPVFSRCQDRNEWWVPLIEKAYAKLHGTYQSLQSGVLQDALVDMTGGISDMMKVERTDACWNAITNYICREGRMMGCSSGGDADDGELGATGLFAQHAYGILWAQEVNGHRLLKLRNPWGEREWKGAWADNSKEWTPAILTTLKHSFGNDGVFWINFEDFTTYFADLDMCRIFNDKNDSTWKNWSHKTINSEWKGPTAAGVFIHNQKDNPQFLLHLREPSDVVFALRQQDYRFTGDDKKDYVFMGFHVVKTDGPSRVFRYDPTQLVATSDPWRNVREVHKHASLQAGYYVIAPSSLKPGDASKFVLRVFCMNNNYDVTELASSDAEFTRVSLNGEWRGKTAGGCANSYKWIYNPQYLLSVTSPSGSTKPVKVHVMLRQNVSEGQAVEHQNIYVLAGNEWTGANYELTPINDPGRFSNAPEVSTEITVTPSLVPYNLMPCTFHPAVERGFTLEAFCKRDAGVTITIRPVQSANISDAEGEWKTGKAGGCTNHDSWPQNPTYNLTLTAPSRVVVLVAQPGQLGIGFLVVKKGTTDIVGQSPTWSRGTSIWAALQLAAGDYGVIPTTFDPNELGPFSLRVESDKPHTLGPAQ